MPRAGVVGLGAIGQALSCAIADGTVAMALVAVTELDAAREMVGAFHSHHILDPALLHLPNCERL